MIETKTCRICKETKTIDQFLRNGKFRRCECRVCGSAQSLKLYYSKHEINLKKRAEIRKKEDPEARFAYRLKYHGITRDQYHEMLRQQEGVCYICKKPPTKLRLSVDHCHRTGKVRGLLCQNCNTALGLLYEDISNCQRMIEYINSGVVSDHTRKT